MTQWTELDQYTALGYAGALDDAIAEAQHATDGLLQLAMGGTAVGTGLNAPVGFGEQVAAQIDELVSDHPTGITLIACPVARSRAGARADSPITALAPAQA